MDAVPRGRKLSVIGAGYVGLATGVGFLKLGYRVVFVDVDEHKVEALSRGESPLREPGVEEILHENKGNYSATTDYGAILDTDVTFIAVGTPSALDGSVDLRYIREASLALGRVLKQKEGFHIVVVKSTVPPGTTEGVVAQVVAEESGKIPGKDFGIAMVPEFLREGRALQDFLHPDRIVIGCNDGRTCAVLRELFEPFSAPKVVVNIRTAEMIKYASNAFLATKISFANEIGNICKKLGIDSWKVLEAVGLDHRVSPHFLRSGRGFGGSCLPKDLRALIRVAESVGEVPHVLKAVEQVNVAQNKRLVQLLEKQLGDLRGRRVGVLGLAFKPGTDDVRESPAISVVEELIRRGAVVMAYDPLAMDNFRKLFPDIAYARSARELVSQTEAVIIVTAWPEFEEIDYSSVVVVDGQRVRRAAQTAKNYEGIGW